MKRPPMPRWLYPGMHIKRWLGAVLLGLTMLALGAAIFLIEAYRQSSSSSRTWRPSPAPSSSGRFERPSCWSRGSP